MSLFIVVYLGIRVVGVMDPGVPLQQFQCEMLAEEVRGVLQRSIFYREGPLRVVCEPHEKLPGLSKMRSRLQPWMLWRTAL